MRRLFPLILIWLTFSCSTIELPEGEPYYLELSGWGVKSFNGSFAVGKHDLKLIVLPIEECAIVIIAEDPNQWDELLKQLDNVCIVGESK